MADFRIHKATARLQENSSSRGGGRTAEGAADRVAGSRSNSFLSVVVHDNVSVSSYTVNYDDSKSDDSYKPSSVQVAKLLSLVYAIILMILGLIFPIAEELSGNWLESGYIAAFLTYLTVVGTIFIIYLQFYLLRKLPKSDGEPSQNRKSTPGAPPPRQGGAVVMGHGHGGSSPRPQSSPSAVSRSKEIYTIEAHCGINNNEEQATTTTRGRKFIKSGESRLSAAVEDEGYGTSNRSIAHPDSGGGGLLAPPSLQTPSLPIITISASPSIRRRILVDNGGEVVGGRGEGGGGEDEFLGTADDLMGEGEEGDDSVEAIDLSSLGSVYSREGSNLYLRLGELLFGMGNMIYYVLEVQNAMRNREQCDAKLTYGWTFIPRLVFVVVQTFFLFKGCNTVVIERHQPLVWFGLMHLIATNACLWCRTVVEEVADEFTRQLTSPGNTTSNPPAAAAGFNATVTTDSVNNFFTSTTTTSSSIDQCDTTTYFASTYLFPIVLEYSLTAVGSLICIIQTALSEENDQGSSVTRGIKKLIKVCRLQKFHENTTADQVHDSHSIHSAHSRHGEGQENRKLLAKSHLGLFLGVMMVVIAVGSVVMYYIYMGTDTAVIIYLSADITLHAGLLSTCVVAFVLTLPLAYRAAPVTGDDLLLLMGMIGSVLFEVSLAIPSASSIDNGGNMILEPLYLTSAVLGGVQSVVQTLLIIVSLRRYPSESWHVTDMPGRGSFGFLIIGNVAVWLLRTLANARSIDFDKPNTYYGTSAWLLLMNINFPLVLFFCFHSSVCFADAWYRAFVPLQQHATPVKPTTVVQNTTVQSLARPAHSDC